MEPINDYSLECCSLLGKDLADFGINAGSWENEFVAAMAAELLEARRRLRESVAPKREETGAIEALRQRIRVLVDEKADFIKRIAELERNNTEAFSDEVARHLLEYWDKFYAKLPDGEYAGLGGLRIAVANLRDLIASKEARK